MGVIRGSFLVLTTSLLFTAFFSAGLLWTLSLSLQHDVLKTEILPLANRLIGEELQLTNQLADSLDLIKAYCESRGSSDFVFSYEGYTFNIPCSSLDGGADEALDKTIENFVDDIYYKNYDCDFIDCFDKSKLPLFLISEKSKNYFEEKLYWALLASLALIVLTFLLVERKPNAFIIIGVFLLISSVPFIAIDRILSLYSDDIVKILSIFLSQADYVFIRMLIIGAVIFVVGMFFRIFNIGLKIYSLFSKKNITEKSIEGKSQKEDKSEQDKKSEKSKNEKTRDK